jgi:Holliday junction resolvase
LKKKIRTSTRYRIGADFERLVKSRFEDAGYVVIRSAGSKSKIDLVALKNGVVPIFIQCKKDGKITESEMRELQRLARQAGATATVISRRDLQNLNEQLKNVEIYNKTSNVEA